MIELVFMITTNCSLSGLLLGTLEKNSPEQTERLFGGIENALESFAGLAQWIKCRLSD